MMIDQYWWWVGLTAAYGTVVGAIWYEICSLRAGVSMWEKQSFSSCALCLNKKGDSSTTVSRKPSWNT
ncbi:hypothetical protein TIFTF001_017587 [Ficus carica]|uniref:Uncharacterized protein n=1 Tax=Ficus carica TaxID=3494 RepID=A0AA88ALF3_FICCA|nr:hypothetical protein TIFTF001_017587 [Ficus carica]